METGLYYNRFRYYDPAAGQYLSPDPLGLDGGLVYYARAEDSNRQIDVFGMGDTCPLVGTRKDNL